MKYKWEIFQFISDHCWRILGVFRIKQLFAYFHHNWDGVCCENTICLPKLISLLLIYYSFSVPSKFHALWVQVTRNIYSLIIVIHRLTHFRLQINNCRLITLSKSIGFKRAPVFATNPIHWTGRTTEEFNRLAGWWPWNERSDAHVLQKTSGPSFNVRQPFPSIASGVSLSYYGRGQLSWGVQ